jgi:hypothetical protein
MKQIVTLTRYEYLMQIRRPGLWWSSLLLTGLVYLFLLLDRGAVPAYYLSQPWPWKLGANLVGPFTAVMPGVAGILVADRFPRDHQFRLTEVLKTALLPSPALALGKYVGALLGVLTPPLLLTAGVVAYLALKVDRPSLVLTVPVALLAVALPSWLVVVAWSLVLPVVIPLRIYQVAFAGFWLWAVAVPPEHLLTINHSILSLQGEYAQFAFFFTGPTPFLHPQATTGWAVLNMSLLLGLALVGVGVLLLAQYHQERAA